MTGEWVQQWQEESDEDKGEMGGGEGNLLQFGSTPRLHGVG